MKLTNQIFFLFCFLLFFVNTSSNSHANSNPLANKFAIIDPSTSSSGNIANSNLDIDILVNPIFPNFVSLPPRGDTLGKRVGFAFAGSNPSFEARLNNNKNNITVKSIDLIDNKNKTFFEVPFKITSIPNTEDEVTLTLDIPNTLSSGLAKFILNTNNGIALKGEIEVLDFFNFNRDGNSPNVTEGVASLTDIQAIALHDFLRRSFCLLAVCFD